MGVRGPNPKPNRRNRTPLTYEWIEVEDTPNMSGPQLPARRRNGGKWPAHAVARWKVWRAMPHTRLWQASDWTFAQDTMELLARLTDDAPAALWAEFRARERILGVTLDARQSMRICYVAPCTDDGSPESLVSLDSYRDL